MQPMQLCLFSGRSFEDTFENAQWRKIKQMQPMVETFVHTLEKVKQMQTMQLCIISFKYAFSQAVNLRMNLMMQSVVILNKCNQWYIASSYVDNFRGHLRMQAGNFGRLLEGHYSLTLSTFPTHIVLDF